MQKERILITGGAGYLGSVLSRHIIERGNPVTIVDNLMYNQDFATGLKDNPLFEIIKGDVRDKELIRRAIRDKEVIIPLATLVGMPICNRNPEDALSINRDAVIMLNELRGINQKLVYPTTNSGYGTKTGEVFCTEETPLDPISVYGISKCEAERALLESAKPAITFRFATIFGFSPRMRLDLLVNDFVFRAMTEKKLVLFEPHFKRNYLHIKDAARVFMHAIDNFDSMHGKPYNVGLEDANLSKMELALKIKSYIPELDISEGDGKDPDQRNYIVSNKRITDTGFRTNFSLDYGIKELIGLYEEILKKETPANIRKRMANI